jgi:hypothetical protein
MKRTLFITVAFMVCAMIFHKLGLVRISSPFGPLAGILALTGIVFVVRISIFLYCDRLIIYEQISKYMVKEKDSILLPAFSSDDGPTLGRLPNNTLIPCYCVSFQSVDNEKETFDSDQFTGSQYDALIPGLIKEVKKSITRSGRVYYKVLH